MFLNLGENEIYIDSEKMNGIPSRNKAFACKCPSCRKFREYADNLPKEVKALFATLGLDIGCPDEVFDAGTDENGSTLYGGWWIIAGKIIKRSDMTFEIYPGFEVNFCDNFRYAPAWFRISDYFQMKFIIRSNGLKRLGKECRTVKNNDTEEVGSFVYNITDEMQTNLRQIVGRELIRIDLDAIRTCKNSSVCRKADIYVKCTHENNYRKISLSAARDMDTCNDAIDRMILSVVADCSDENESIIAKQGGLSDECKKRITKIAVYESEIAGKKDSVIYDSHIMIELETGEKYIFRVEPDAEEAIYFFDDANESVAGEALCASDKWFVPDSSDLGFYKTITRERLLYEE